MNPLLTRSALLLTLLPLRLLATGDYWSSPSYLDGSAKVLKAAPEFFWHDELQRLAEKYRDKASAGMKIQGAPGKDGFMNFNGPLEDEEGKPGEEKARPSVVADAADFEDALKTGKLKPADAAAARAAHGKAREAIEKEQPLPGGEADSEFADYHAGAAAAGKPEAAAAWEKLLARPAEQRHYRSVWAAFMLGKHALAQKQWTEAVKFFRQCRSLAKEGFADTLALAADSFGWEARAELMQDHFPQAARLYLTQLAMGDPSAIVSLKRCIPDWYSPASGGLPGEPLPEENPAQPAPAPEEKPEAPNTARWQAAAKDAALQELVTAHILATDTVEYTEDYTRSKLWLETLTKAGVDKVEDAARLAWLAYNAGDYKGARGWLTKADAKLPLARWLEAKFALRDGKLDAAAQIMPEVAQGVPEGEPVSDIVPPHDRARGELGALLYSKGLFVEAFAKFLEGHCDEDVKFMIESVLTVEELTALAAKVPAAEDGEDGNWRPAEIRSEIARRLIREGKVKEGRPFLKEEERKVMDEYIAFAVKAEDKTVSAEERAKAWWEAAVLMLDRGHEFRGTEDDFHKPSEDDGTEYTVRGQRLTGKYAPVTYSDDEPKTGKLAVFLAPSEAEKKRLAATAKQHAKPARTRMVAASHLLKAADLLPDKSEVKARVLNTAGYWLQDIDNPQADRIFARLKKDFQSTPTGQAAVKKRWFTGRTHPWQADKPAGEGGEETPQ